MSSTRPSWTRMETLSAITLHKPIKVKVTCDVGGITVFGQDELKGYVGSGITYEHAMSVFIDGLITDYYEYSIHPSEVQTKEDDKRGVTLKRLFWRARMMDVDNVEVRR